MKLQTTISPRRDGNVSVVGITGTSYVFSPNEDGLLECDVQDADVGALVEGGHFYPSEPEDIEAALALTSRPQSEDEGDDDGDMSSEQPGGLPIEANTPPKPGKVKTRKGK